MPDIAGQVVILTVSDAGRSAAWYGELLGMRETSRYAGTDGHVELVHLTEPGSGTELCLAAHRGSEGRFDEFRSGWITWNSWSPAAVTSTPGHPG